MAKRIAYNSLFVSTTKTIVKNGDSTFLTWGSGDGSEYSPVTLQGGDTVDALSCPIAFLLNAMPKVYASFNGRKFCVNRIGLKRLAISGDFPSWWNKAAFLQAIPWEQPAYKNIKEFSISCVSHVVRIKGYRCDALAPEDDKVDVYNDSHIFFSKRGSGCGYLSLHITRIPAYSELLN